MGNENNVHVSVYAYMDVEKKKERKKRKEKKKERKESILTMMVMNCIQKALKTGRS